MSLSKPRVVVLCHTGLYSGAEVVLERVVSAAVRAGWNVTVLVPEGRARDRLAAAGAIVHQGPNLKLPFGSKALGMANRAILSLEAARLLRKEARYADLVLVNSFHALPALAVARLRVPSVWLLHQVITSRFRLALVRLTKRAGYFTVAVSEAAAAPVRKLGLSVHVIHNGTPSPVPLAPEEPPKQPVVGCAAALTKWKGQDVLLEAVARLDSSVHVELLGQPFPKDAAYERSLRARAGQSDLSGRVRFLGFREDVLDVMRSWTVAVSASVDPEAVGLTTLEAMSVGIPVVGTDIGATPAIVDGAGVLVPPRDPEAMASAISRVIGDVELWRRCHRAGPARVEARFRLDRQLDSVLDWLEVIAQGGSSSAGMNAVH
jgi:glycosyltransferase involved in cell wall biosynthesis